MTPPTAAELKKIARDYLNQCASERLADLTEGLDKALRDAAADGLFMIRLGEVRTDCADQVREGLIKLLRPRGFTVIVEAGHDVDDVDGDIEVSAVYVDWAGAPQTT